MLVNTITVRVSVLADHGSTDQDHDNYYLAFQVDICKREGFYPIVINKCDRICENVHSSHKNLNSFFDPAYSYTQ